MRNSKALNEKKNSALEESKFSAFCCLNLFFIKAQKWSKMEKYRFWMNLNFPRKVENFLSILPPINFFWQKAQKMVKTENKCF